MRPTKFDQISSITTQFNETERVIPCECLEVSTPLLFEEGDYTSARLLRAATDQICSDPSTLSRYRIWAETLRGSLISAIDSLGPDQLDRDVRRSLVRVTNSLGAFCQVQALFDSASEGESAER